MFTQELCKVITRFKKFFFVFYKERIVFFETFRKFHSVKIVFFHYIRLIFSYLNLK
jgi:hypothetical protein